MERKKKTHRLIDETVRRALEEAEYYGAESEEYAKIMESVNTLCDAKSKLDDGKKKVDPNIVVQALGTAALVLLTLHYEEAQCLTSKAVGWIRKLW